MEALRPGDPARIGPFTPVARIGSGGMGRVYLARSRGGRPVAVKVVRGEYAEDAAFRTRFRREVEAARTVGGVYTATVLDAGPEDDQPWLATAYIPGPSLQQLVAAGGPLPERSARILGAGIAEALDAIHKAGLIHRDLKPSNVICGPDGPRVIDFGISHAVGGTSLTATGLVVGSPRYASPEQCRADAEAGPASDVFALGGVLVYATTGLPPFGEGPDHVQLYLVVHEEPELAAVPAGLRPIVAACLAKEPADRPSIDEVLDSLLPNAGGFEDGGEDWLPSAAGGLLSSYAVAGVGTRVADLGATPGVEGTTHQAETDGPGHTGAHGAGTGVVDLGLAGPAAADVAAAGAAPAALAAAAAPAPGRRRAPTRRRLLTGFVGLGAMAASGGAAWWAATKKDGHAGAAGSTGAALPPATHGDTPATTAAGGGDGATAAVPGRLFNVLLDLTFGKGAVVGGGRLVGIHQNTGSASAPLTLVAIDATSGASAWQKPFPQISQPNALPLAGDEENVYSYAAGTVTAWRLADGQQMWQVGTGLPVPTADNAGAPESTVLGLVAGVLFVGVANPDPGSQTALVGIDVAKQTVSWTRTSDQLRSKAPSGLTAGDVTVNITVPASGSLAYLTLSDSVSARQLKALTPATGKEAWSVPFTHRSQNLSPQPYPTVTGTPDMVYLTDMHSGYLHAYSTTGTWKWTFPKSASPDAVSSPVDSRYTGLVTSGNGVVYACDTTTVHAFDVATGTPVTAWERGATSTYAAGLRSNPVLTGGRVWGEADTPAATTGPLTLFALDPTTGRSLQELGVPTTAGSPEPDVLVSAHDALYVVSAAGAVSAYQPK